MFDRTHLPEALFEFVVITDTHYMLDVGDKPLEFESRRKQTARARHALQLVKTLNADLVMHLGDRAQEYHGTDRHKQAMTEAAEQMARIGVEVHPVAGNQDVGDKPDPTMPAPHVSQEVLDWYHENVGSSWYSFDHEGCHFVVLNSQIMNTDLAEANEQRDWVEADL
ncbi:MAG: metallophosphoesterase, partial [Planctomycetota bacterium]|nr:metallophosphoesterase [Planctomycetota bacterium]